LKTESLSNDNASLREFKGKSIEKIILEINWKKYEKK